MSEKNQEHPYKSLGARLRGARERLRESLAEVSGAVEIDPEHLTAIELGTARPTEDVLLLLISHFAVKEDEATKLWELAGYDQADTTTFSMSADELGAIKQAVMVMPIDARISYTDMAHVVVNEHGVVLNFMQTGGPNNQPMVVSRVGMSKEHAESIIALLQKTLNESKRGIQQKSLPAPDQSRDTAQES